MPVGLDVVIKQLREVQKSKPFKEISKFPHLLHHKKRVKLFNELIKAYNMDLCFVKRLEGVEDTYKCLEQNLKNSEEQKNINKYFDVKMAEVVEKFRVGKKTLNDEITNLKKSCGELSKKLETVQQDRKILVKNLREVEKALCNCKRILDALKVNRAKSKKIARDIGVVDGSSFIHSIYNCKNNNCTGMAGTLTEEHIYIWNNIKNSKHIHSDEINLHIKNLVDPSVKKAFMDSKATYNTAVNMARQFKFTENYSEDVNIESIKNKVKEMEGRIDEIIEEFINKLLSLKVFISKTIKSHVKSCESKLEELRNEYITLIPSEHQIWFKEYFDMYVLSSSIEFYSIYHKALTNLKISKENLALLETIIVLPVIGMIPLPGALIISLAVELPYILMFCGVLIWGLFASIDRVSKSRYNPLKGNSIVDQN